MNDLISRQAAIDKLETVGYDFSNSGLSEIELEEVCEAVGDVRQDMISMIKRLPSAQTEIIRCKDCRWWDKYGDYDNGYCMAAKHGYWSEHWDISIRRTYKGDFYCADAEPKGEQE